MTKAPSIKEALADLIGHAKLVATNFDIHYAHLERCEAALATSQPSGERREAIARIIDPDRWGTYDFWAPKDDNLRREYLRSSLEKADRISGCFHDEVAGVSALLEETECKDIDDLRDMANVGKATMDAIQHVVTTEGPFKGWSPSQCPSEIIIDLVNALIDAKRPHTSAILASGLVQDEAGSVATWMIQHGYVTGHGDTLDDLLGGLVAAEREKCAKIADLFVNHDAEYGAKYPDEAFKFDNRWLRSKTIADAIRSARNGGAET